MIDEVAERARALGGRAYGSLKEFLDNASIKEEAQDNLKAEEMITRLREDHETLARQLRDEIERCVDLRDQPTADLLTGIQKMHEKAAWMLRSYLTVR